MDTSDGANFVPTHKLPLPSFTWAISGIFRSLQIKHSASPLAPFQNILHITANIFLKHKLACVTSLPNPPQRLLLHFKPLNVTYKALVMWPPLHSHLVATLSAGQFNPLWWPSWSFYLGLTSGTSHMSLLSGMFFPPLFTRLTSDYAFSGLFWSSYLKLCTHKHHYFSSYMYVVWVCVCVCLMSILPSYKPLEVRDGICLFHLLYSASRTGPEKS